MDIKTWAIKDSIISSTPQRVEEAVIMQTPQRKIDTDSDRPHQERQDEESTEHVPYQSAIENDQIESYIPRPAVSPTASQKAVLPSVYTVESSRKQQQVGLRSEIEDPLEIINALPLSARTIGYPLGVDSLDVMENLALQNAQVKRGISSYSLDNQKDGVPLPITLDRSDGIFSLLLLCFLFLAHLYSGGMAFFRESVMLLFSSGQGDKLESQRTTKEIFYSYFLLFLSVFLLSISLFEALDSYIPLTEEHKHPFVTIGFFAVLILAFIFVKLLLNKLIGYIFDIKKRMRAWNQSFVVLMSMLGLLCFFPTLMLVYSNLWHDVIIGFVFTLFLIVQIILLVRIIMFFIGERYNILYLIAYLCTVEILPYVFLGVGLVYLYRIDIFNIVL